MSAPLHPHAGSTRTNRTIPLDNCGWVGLEGDYPLKALKRLPRAATTLVLLVNARCTSAQEWSRARNGPSRGPEHRHRHQQFTTGAIWRSIRRRRSTKRAQDQHNGVSFTGAFSLAGRSANGGVAMPVSVVI